MLTVYGLQGTRRPHSVAMGKMPQSVVEDEIHPKAQTKLSPQCLEVSGPNLYSTPIFIAYFSKGGDEDEEPLCPACH